MTTVWTPFEATFYGGGAQGYTDYSVLNGWRP
jgi:hypothetical protein